MTRFRIISHAILCCITCVICRSAELVVTSPSVENRRIAFQYRVPKDYSPERQYHVLIYFGGRNTDGRAEASGRMGWGAWCDANGVFILAPGFRNDTYWEPEKWSGKAMLDALAELKKHYSVDTEHLLYYGYSAGSQASNLFAAWNPDRCIAWVAHACGYFHTPSPAMCYTPGLVTCGDADPLRHVIGRRFVREYREMGVVVIWKTLPNRRHEETMASVELARAFLGFHLQHHRRKTTATSVEEMMVRYPFVGDDLTGNYYPADSTCVQSIQENERVSLPDKAVAEAWKKAAE